MADLDQRSEGFLRGLFETTVEKARGMSAYMAPGLGGKKLSDEDVSLAWNTRALTVEQEWDLWRIGRTPETAGQRILTPEEIGMQVFPHRERIAKSGGRVQPKEWFSWVNQRAERERKKKEQQQPSWMAEGQTDGTILVPGDEPAQPVGQYDGHGTAISSPAAAELRGGGGAGGRVL
jgi:hypothetical protein